jgi:polyhydroxybutyrate depolymerase
MRFDGLNRSYDIHIPSSYDGLTSVPLVLDFHGLGSNKEQQAFISGFIEKSDEEGFIVVHPQGFQNSWNSEFICCGSALSENIDDKGFAIAIVNEISGALNIDRSRVYGTGLSDGGAFSHFLACEAADLFAAVAPVSFPLAATPFSECMPSRPIPVIHFHGLNDLIVPYSGFGPIPPTPDSFEYWGEVNGCTSQPETTFSLGDSMCESFIDCDDGVEVTLCSIAGGHILYFNSDGVNIADLAWDFLSRFQLR